MTDPVGGDLLGSSPPIRLPETESSQKSSELVAQKPAEQRIDDTTEVKRGDRLIYAGQEDTRKLALFILAGLVGGVLAVGALLTGLAGDDDKKITAAREFIEIGFTPLLGLFGAAVAYYYASK